MPKHGKPFKRKNKVKNVSKISKKQRTHLKQFGEEHPADVKSTYCNLKKIKLEDISENKNSKLPSSSSDSEFEDDTSYQKLIKELGVKTLKSFDAFDKGEFKYIDDKIKSTTITNKNDKHKLKSESSDSDNVTCDNIENKSENLSDNGDVEQNLIENSTYCIDDDSFLKDSDPFSTHFEIDLNDNDIKSFSDRATWVSRQDSNVDIIGESTVFQSTAYKIQNSNITGSSSQNLHLKPSLEKQIKVTNEKILKLNVSEKDPLNCLQLAMMQNFKNYMDFYYYQRSYLNGEDIRLAYCLHALNHVLKTRSRIVSHNTKIKLKSDDCLDTYRDQGLTRPKVLILVPFRESALRCVKLMMKLLNSAGSQTAMNKKRFIKEYGSISSDDRQGFKPADFEATFDGNIDDYFRIGLAVARKTLKIYTDFYSSDILIASPLGLRTVIGAEGDKDHDFDFLSSIEILILDQTDVFLMQNWDHVLHIFKHLHQQPKEPHGVDFSRVRMWCLNGWSSFYRQTLLFSSVQVPEIQSLINKYCFNYAGKVHVNKTYKHGSICNIRIRLPQIFQRITVNSIKTAMDERFEYFKSKLMTKLKQPINGQTMLFVSSYFDFVRIRNFLIKEEINFGHISEYSKDKVISRARSNLFHNKIQLLLYTERFHFYKRYHIRGIRHLLFYSLPIYPIFFSEISNFLEDTCKKDINLSPTCMILWDKYDFLKLSSIVGTSRGVTMLNSEKDVHMFTID